MARPPKPAGEARTTYARIRVTQAECAIIKKRAKDAGFGTTAAWIRHKLLGSNQ